MWLNANAGQELKLWSWFQWWMVMMINRNCCYHSWAGLLRYLLYMEIRDQGIVFQSFLHVRLWKTPRWWGNRGLLDAFSTKINLIRIQHNGKLLCFDKPISFFHDVEGRYRNLVPTDRFPVAENRTQVCGFINNELRNVPVCAFTSDAKNSTSSGEYREINLHSILTIIDPLSWKRWTALWRRLRRRRLLDRCAESRRKRWLATESALARTNPKASFCFAGTAPHDALGMIHFDAPLFLDFCCRYCCR